jgi:hypothetical protein
MRECCERAARAAPGEVIFCPDFDNCEFRTMARVVRHDPVVHKVRLDLLERSQRGIKKYGTTLDRTDLKLKDWLQHAYEETLDLANYLKRSILELESKERGEPNDA